MKRFGKRESRVSLDVATIEPFLDEHHLEVADGVASFAVDELSQLPHPDVDDAARHQSRELLARIGGAGWCRYAIEEEYGGAASGPDLRACCLIREALAQVSTLADSIFALQCLGSMPITLAGSEEQKKRFLPGIAKGRRMAAFAMTEEEAGSDVAAMQTRAERDPFLPSKIERDDLGDEPAWCIDGTKHLITNAGLAKIYVVFAVTAGRVTSFGGSRSEVRRSGISCFVVEAGRPGLRFGGPQILSEPHPLGVVSFSGCRVPPANLVGEEGGGFTIGMKTLDRLRATVAAAACGMARRALDEALFHVHRREQFGKPLRDYQLVQEKIARMATELDAARLLTYRAAAAADAGSEKVTLTSAMAKSYATEAAQKIVDEAVQIVGGRGVLADHPVDRLYRAVRALRIYEGTTEIQRLVIAKQLLKDEPDEDFKIW